MDATATTLDDIVLIAGVTVILIGGGVVLTAMFGYSIMTSLFSFGRQAYNKVKESDNMSICSYFRRRRQEIDNLKKRVDATEQEVSQLKQAVALPVVYRNDNGGREKMAEEKTEIAPVKLEATVRDMERVKGLLLAQYQGMPEGEAKADKMFVGSEVLRQYAQALLDAHYDGISENMLLALVGHQGATTKQAQGMEAALQAKDVKAYIRGASGLVGSICEGVSKATKFQCAVNRDHEGYKAEVAENIAQLLDTVKQNYLQAPK